ncbi:glycosyltransferase [Polynucleobacter sp. 73C-SIWE]|uniref:glycosyltransferase family 4 protein n=1 Tax=Polynucleobacter sp. 73C-SIWE TaxID=2689098 RepID=UPI001C0DEDAF|nr:glycosyltransferase [Polynucleobacter sp. 73C-SIWE]MBU3578637.1 glycosyltransferase [Polynucleobacter sp. 73C-SIWE]
MRIAISWNELPCYAAHLIAAGIKGVDNPVQVISTRPTIPITGMEEILGQKVHWIDKDNIYTWEQLGLDVPEIYFQAGITYIPSLRRLGDQVRKSGGRVVLLSDNCWKNSYRQWVGMVAFRVIYRKQFHAVWVPGASGVKLMRKLGVSAENLFTGLYGSDPDIFFPKEVSLRREDKFIFVGQLIKRKGVDKLVAAFSRFHQKHPEFQLDVYGAGPLASAVSGIKGINLRSFSKPETIAEALKRSKFLILPSLEDHWPLIVSEAAMSGCGLLLSDKIGNIPEFANEKNSFIFNTTSDDALYESMLMAAQCSENTLNEISRESCRLGMKFTPSNWAINFKKIIHEIAQ